MPGMATPNIVFLWSMSRRLGGGGAAGALAIGDATPMMVCLPAGAPPAARAALAPGGAPTGTGAVGIPSIVAFAPALFCGAGAATFGAIPTMVLFIDAEGGALGRGAGFSLGASSSVAPHTPQCASEGLTDDPHRGQTIMLGDYHVEVAGRPEFE
jgi:hypothetical protein